MDVVKRRAGVKTRVAAGSVWESRMKLDEVKGGIKVFNGEENSEETVETGAKKLVKRGPIGTSGVATSGKRKTWKSESFDGPIQIAKGKTESTSIKNCEEQGKELSSSVDGIKKIPNQTRKGRYEGCKELSLSVDGMDRSPIQVQKGGSKGSREPCVSVDGIDKSPIQVKKGRSEANKEVRVSGDENEKSPTQIRKARSDTREVVESAVAQLRKSKSDSDEVANQSGEEVAADNGIQGYSIHQKEESMSASDKVLEESVRSGDETFSGIEKNPPEIEETGSEESCKEFGVCQEKVISSSENMQKMESPPKPLMDAAVAHDDDDDHDVMDGEDEELEEEIEIEVEKKSFDIKEIDIPEEKAKKVETNTPEPKSQKMEISIPEQKSKEIVNDKKKVHQLSNKTASTSSTANKQPLPVMRRATIYQNFSKPTLTPVASRYKSFPETHSKLQNLVDLVMWRDISRSAFVFGIGTFIIISSSYSKDLNISFISVISYLGLFHLATIFLYRSLIYRGVYHMDNDTGYVLGEEEAFWLVKLLLPYLNEFLLKIRALFSGDPSTTMKMAVLLFALARCGSSITIWKMAKLGFFGVFTVPKVCSLYSTQLTAYAKFWIRRFGDAWDSCTHKKAVALAIFTLVWNLSSMVARIWAVFMMFVAVRYYQQTMERDDWVEEEEQKEENDDEQCNDQGQKQGGGSTTVVKNSKAKKKY
uniref:Reticulon-like protein n=1 Tax=Rhizophora mucronata TaxID=61149 RepID=A0A2P2K576_RHIMU